MFEFLHFCKPCVFLKTKNNKMNAAGIKPSVNDLASLAVLQQYATAEWLTIATMNIMMPLLC